jgi:hypothetical protein
MIKIAIHPDLGNYPKGTRIKVRLPTNGNVCVTPIDCIIKEWRDGDKVLLVHTPNSMFIGTYVKTEVEVIAVYNPFTPGDEDPWNHPFGVSGVIEQPKEDEPINPNRLDQLKLSSDTHFMWELAGMEHQSVIVSWSEDQQRVEYMDNVVDSTTFTIDPAHVLVKALVTPDGRRAMSLIDGHKELLNPNTHPVGSVVELLVPGTTNGTRIYSVWVSIVEWDDGTSWPEDSTIQEFRIFHRVKVRAIRACDKLWNGEGTEWIYASFAYAVVEDGKSLRPPPDDHNVQGTHDAMVDDDTIVQHDWEERDVKRDPSDYMEFMDLIREVKESGKRLGYDVKVTL